MLGSVSFKGRVQVDVAFDVENGRAVEIVSLTGTEELDTRNRVEVEKAVREAVMATKCSPAEAGRRRLQQSFAFRLMP